MWLRDFLPGSVPNARILTYGYDTKLPGSQSSASILELSRRFLESLKTIRSTNEVSLPAMVYRSAQLSNTYRDIAQSCLLDTALAA